MKNSLLFVLLSSFLMLTSCRNNDYNLGFELGSTEEDIIEYIQENNLKCRYEEKKDMIDLFCELMISNIKI